MPPVRADSSLRRSAMLSGGALLCLLMLVSIPVDASCDHHRSQKAKAQFAARNPCPSTGVAKPSHCAGWVVDHSRPLCAGGKDSPANMTWEQIGESKIKDGEERRLCSMVQAGKVSAKADDAAICAAMGPDFPLMRKAMHCG